MTSNVIFHDFRGHKLRHVIIDGEPWFVGADIVRILGLDNAGNAYKRLGADEWTNIRRADVGEKPGRPMVVVSESGLYKLIMRSDKALAAPFQDWVTRESCRRSARPAATS